MLCCFGGWHDVQCFLRTNMGRTVGASKYFEELRSLRCCSGLGDLVGLEI
jgi:hypothetical protein